MKKIMLLLAIIGLTSSCEEEDYPLPNRCGAPEIEAADFNGYDFIFNTEINNLKSGEINSIFKEGNRLILSVGNATLNTTGNPFLRNCLVIVEGDAPQVVFNPDGPTPQSLIPEPDEQHFYSINQVNAAGEDLEVICSLWRQTGPGRFDIEHVRDELALIGPDGQLLAMQTITSGETKYGSALLHEGGYLYVFGSKNLELDKQAFVARVAGSTVTGTWEYFNGANWTADANQASPITYNVAEYFSVFREKDHYYMVTNGSLFGQQVLLKQSASLVTGWKDSRTLYCSADNPDGFITSNAVVMDHQENAIVLSYGYIEDNLTGSATLEPEFIKLLNWMP